jgi:uncharacterized protein HemX
MRGDRPETARFDPAGLYRNAGYGAQATTSLTLSLGVLAIAVAILVGAGLSVLQTLQARSGLQEIANRLEQSHRPALRLQIQSESMVRRFRQLAEQGNKDAKELLEELAAQGILVDGGS